VKVTAAREQLLRPFPQLPFLLSLQQDPMKLPEGVERELLSREVVGGVQ